MIPFRYIDRTLAFIGFAFLIGSLDAILTTFDSTIGGADSAGNLKIQIFSMSIYVFSIFLIVHRLEKFLFLLSRNVLLILFLLLPAFSVFWSIAPDITARRAFALTGTMLFVSYVAIAFTPEQALRVLALSFGVTALVSLSFAIALPGMGTHEAGPYTGVWRGMFAHKNKLGGMMVLAAATIIICPKYHKKEKVLGYLGACISLFLVVMSQSKTALVILFALIFSLPLIHWMSGRGLRTLERVIFVLIIVFSCAIAVFQQKDTILEALGKDATLTGRTETWLLAWNNVLEHPAFGHGYRVFWSDRSPARMAPVEGWRDKISHSHNTYLDLALDLGFVGSLAFLAILSLFIKRLFHRIRKQKDKINLWMFSFLFYMILSGITERSVLEQSDIVWAVFVLSYFHLSKISPAKKKPQDEESLVPTIRISHPSFGCR